MMRTSGWTDGQAQKAQSVFTAFHLADDDLRVGHEGGREAAAGQTLVGRPVSPNPARLCMLKYPKGASWTG